MKRIILTTIIFFAASLIMSPEAQAACSFGGTTNVTISTSCTVNAGITDGPDNGTGATNNSVLTLSSGTLTIGTNSILAVGSITITGGSTAFASGAQIRIKAPLYALDSDGDGYASSLTFSITSDVGWVRRNSLTSVTEVDCNDAAASASNCCLAPEYC